jgi:hypothetical protein
MARLLVALLAILGLLSGLAAGDAPYTNAEVTYVFHIDHLSFAWRRGQRRTASRTTCLSHASQHYQGRPRVRDSPESSDAAQQRLNSVIMAKVWCMNMMVFALKMGRMGPSFLDGAGLHMFPRISN